MDDAQLDRVFRAIHNNGADRHPTRWMEMNQLAADCIVDIGGRLDNKELRTLASLVTLKILDRLRRLGTPDEPNDDNIERVLQRVKAPAPPS